MTYKDLGVKDRVQNIHCETCDDLLEYLRPSHNRWLADDRQLAWLFRGHQQEDWKLEPYALREKVAYFDPIKTEHHYTPLISILIDEFSPPSDTEKSQRVYDLLVQTICEKIAIQQFIEAADDVGLAIPDDNISRDFQLWNQDFLRKLHPIDPTNPHNRYAFIPWYLHSDTVALAQHHSIPTRLLDWTENPLKAAYFAATSSEEVGKSENIAIWAINQVSLSLTDLRLVKPRRNRIGFLHAQDGVFIYDIMGNNHYFEHGKWQTFEDILANLEDPTSFIGFPDTRYWLRKITFPVAKTEELLLRLRAHKIEKRFLMPTYDNVANELHARRKTDNRMWEQQLEALRQVGKQNEL